MPISPMTFNVFGLHMSDVGIQSSGSNCLLGIFGAGLTLEMKFARLQGGILAEIVPGDT